MIVSLGQRLFGGFLYFYDRYSVRKDGTHRSTLVYVYSFRGPRGIGHCATWGASSVLLSWSVRRRLFYQFPSTYLRERSFFCPPVQLCHNFSFETGSALLYIKTPDRLSSRKSFLGPPYSMSFDQMEDLNSSVGHLSSECPEPATNFLISQQIKRLEAFFAPIMIRRRPSTLLTQ